MMHLYLTLNLILKYKYNLVNLTVRDVLHKFVLYDELFIAITDDLKVFACVSSINDYVILQGELNILFDWCQKWRMNLNVDKCFAMCFYRSHEHIKFAFSVNNNVFIFVSTIKDRVLTLTHNLNFRDHIETVVNKSLKVLGFVKRHSSIRIRRTAEIL